jgi:8-oxo-dGTP pyrophosphatase MutT (NUDIX family)
VDAYFQGLKQRLAARPAPSLESQGLKLKEAAVLAPLFLRDGEPWAYLTRRPMTLRKHPGQISFPGGAREPLDTTPLHTALRETQEELGIAPAQVEVLGVLGGLPVVTGYYVTPFVGALPSALHLKPDPTEIEEVLEVPLKRLRAARRVVMQAERDVFLYGDGAHIIWGATARMVKQLLEYV